MVHSYLRFSEHIVHVPKSALQMAKRAAGLGYCVVTVLDM